MKKTLVNFLIRSFKVHYCAKIFIISNQRTLIIFWTIQIQNLFLKKCRKSNGDEKSNYLTNGLVFAKTTLGSSRYIELEITSKVMEIHPFWHLLPESYRRKKTFSPIIIIILHPH